MFDLFGNSSDNGAQSALDFPQPLTDRYRPRTMAEFVGLAKPKALIAKLAARPIPSAWLFVGPSGTGKTTMAMALGEMIPAEVHHIPSQNCDLATLERVCRTCQYVPAMGKRMHLILVDEADQMTPAAQLFLLSKLDSTAQLPNTIWAETARFIRILITYRCQCTKPLILLMPTIRLCFMSARIRPGPRLALTA